MTTPGGIPPRASSRPDTRRGAARHIPVLLDEMLAALAPQAGRTYIDGTFGAGGYSRAILAAADCAVLALDRDPDAIAGAGELAGEFPGRLTVVEAAFGRLEEVARDYISAAATTGAPDGIVLDLGVSSMQLDEARRGFSFQADGPLDMRMSSAGPSAATVVNEASEGKLADILYQLGEERRSRAIARAIVAAREASPITTTRALANLVERVLGRPRGDDKHPATRSFQALRIYVNDELGELARGLAAAERLLAPDGRLAVVSFHSLEDRIVKRFLARRSGRESAGSRHLPARQAQPAPSFRIVNQRPLTAGEAEARANPRARSARMRVAIRSAAPAWTDADASALGVPVIGHD